MEDQDFCAAALAHDFADHARIRLVANLAFFAGNRDHRKLNLPVRAGSDLLHSNYIARRHPVLLPTGADNRVHTSASVKMSLKSSPAIGTEPKPTPALKGIADFLCLLCFCLGASAAKAGVPRTGRRVQSNSLILSCAVEIGQTKCLSGRSADKDKKQKLQPKGPEVSRRKATALREFLRVTSCPLWFKALLFWVSCA